MSEINNIHQKHIVKNIVDNAVIGYTDTVTIPAPLSVVFQNKV